MTPNFYNAFVLFIDVVSLGATLQKECCPIKSNERGKSAARRVSSSRKVFIRDLVVRVVAFCLFIIKGLFRFFFLLKF